MDETSNNEGSSLRGKGKSALLLIAGTILLFVNFSIFTSISQFGAYNDCGEHHLSKSMANSSDNVPPDTSIILLSSLIPTHPSIKMINDTFNSFSMLNGLAPSTPVYISVDGLPMTKINDDSIHRLNEYVKSLRKRFQNEPRVTILNNYEMGHISNSIRVSLEMVKTKYIYVVQHDFKFLKLVNHTALTKSMRENPEIMIVRFGKGNTAGHSVNSVCNESNYIEANGLKFTRGAWSDNNHFTTKAYYDQLLAQIGPSPRPPEAPMMYQGGHIHESKPSDQNCSFAYQYVYNLKDGPYIEHLDGRLSTSYGRLRYRL